MGLSFTGPLIGTLVRVWSKDGEDYLCSGICDYRGPLWQTHQVDWEDINCPRCLVLIDEYETIEE